MKRWFVFLLIMLCFVPLVSSKIIFYSDYDKTFSAGDMLTVNLSINPVESGKGYFDVYIDCNSEEIVYRKSSNFISGKVYWVDFSFPVSLEGNCSLRAVFRDESQKSIGFVISDKVNINYDLNKIVFYPGESIVINGTAKKGNGENLNGVLKINISGILEKTIDVTNGKFSYNFLIPHDAGSRIYELSLYAYDEDVDGVLNSGREKYSIEVLPKPTSIKIYSNEVVTPPSNFTFNVALFDQGTNLMKNKTLQIKLVDSNLNSVFDKVVLNNQTIFYYFPSDSLVDTWKIYAYYGNLSSSTPVYVGANRQIVFDYLSNEGKLRVENVGNVKYEGVVSYFVSDGNTTKEIPINVNLETGKYEEYPLVEGSYNLSIGNQKWENVIITGAAVFSDFNLSKKSYVVSFSVILFLVFLIVLIKNRKKIKKFFSRERKEDFVERKNRSVEEKSGHKKIYSVFISVENFSSDLEKLSTKNGLLFRRITEKDLFSVFVSSSSERKLLNFARELQKIDKKVSVFVNSKIFDESKLTSLKDFALFGKKIFSSVKGRGIVLSKDIFEALGMKEVNYREFRVGEEIVKVAYLG